MANEEKNVDLCVQRYLRSHPGASLRDAKHHFHIFISCMLYNQKVVRPCVKLDHSLYTCDKTSWMLRYIISANRQDRSSTRHLYPATQSDHSRGCSASSHAASNSRHPKDTALTPATPSVFPKSPSRNSGRLQIKEPGGRHTASPRLFRCFCPLLQPDAAHFLVVDACYT